MTNEEAINSINALIDLFKMVDAQPHIKKEDKFKPSTYEALKIAIKALKQTDKIEESNFSTKQYKADLQSAYDCGYNSGYAQAMMDIVESEG